MALESMHKALSESDIRHLIEARRKGEHDKATRLFVAKQEGIEMGVLKGQVNLARAMLARGILLEEVLSISGLSPDLLT